MAKAKTATFTISEEVTLATVSPTDQSSALPIGSLIAVGDAQALEIEQVDFVIQGYDTTDDEYSTLKEALNGDTDFNMQLMDANKGTLISAADNNLIASGAFTSGTAGGGLVSGDFFPDDFRNDSGRFVVNDELYLVVRGSGTYTANHNCRISVRIKAKVVKLTTRDWMAISLETVQNE